MGGHDMLRFPYAMDYAPAEPSRNDGISESSLKDFTNLKVIGKGTYGRVFRGVRLADNKEYAIKEISIGAMGPKDREDALNEVRVLASLESNPHAIKYYDAFLENDKLFIVTELAKGGDLSAKVKRHLERKERIEEDTIWTYLIQLCQGLHALHSAKVIHRDIKSANIYLMSTKQVKIGDFGISKVLKGGMATTQIGTPYYMSPEVWLKQRYNDKSDVWALGVVLYEMAALRHPFQAQTESALRDRILRGHIDPLPPYYSPSLQNLIRLLLTPEPRSRPSTAQLLAHPAIASRLPAADGGADPRPRPSGQPLLFDTIRVTPKLTRQQIQRRLPGPMYDSCPAAPTAAPAVAAPPRGALLPPLSPMLPAHRPPAGGDRPSARALPGGGLAPLPSAGSDRLSDISGGGAQLPAMPSKILSECRGDVRYSMPDLHPQGSFKTPLQAGAAAAAAAEKRLAAAMAYRQSRGRRGLNYDVYTPLPGRAC